MDASKPSRGMMPACADSPENDAMPTGPMSCFGEVSPVNKPPSVRKMRPVASQFWATLIFSASNTPGSTCVSWSLMPMPIAQVFSARLIGTSRTSCSCPLRAMRMTISLAFVFADQFGNLSREADRLAVDRQDHVLGLQPGLVGRLPGDDRPDVRVGIGQDADFADLVLALSLWRDRLRGLLPVTFDQQASPRGAPCRRS